MNALTVTSKGQVTLRKDVLQHLGVNPGDKIIVDKLPDGRIEVRASVRQGNISDTFNVLKAPNQPVLSIEELDTLAQQGWASRR